MIYSFKTDDFTSDFLKKCRHNPNVPQGLSKDTKNVIKQIAPERGLYSQVLNIRRSIQKTGVVKEPLVEDENHNNDN